LDCLEASNEARLVRVLLFLVDGFLMAMVEMATIRNRVEYQLEAQICSKGYPAQRKTVETKSDAQAWARMIESEIDRESLSLGLNALPLTNSLIDTSPRSPLNTKARTRKSTAWER
jgi:hypothetical protein